MDFARFIQRVPSSATIEMAQKARDLAASGADVISLSLGEPDFDTPDHVCQAGKDAIDAGYTRYTPVPGLLSLRQAICRKFERENDLHYTPDQVVVSTGAKQTIANVVLCTVDPGQDVILPAPYWVSYAGISRMADANVVRIATTVDHDFKITPDALRAALTERSRLLIFSSPCNPTGSVYSRAELEALAAVVLDHPDLLVLSDEIYEHINFSDEPHTSMASIEGMAERTITVNGVSKGFAMTGWRIGYMGAPAALATACARLQGQFTSGASAISQKAVEAALDGDLAPTHRMRDIFRERRDHVLDRLRRIDGFTINVPEGAFYVFPDVSAFFGRRAGDRVIETPTDLVMYLLEEAHVALVGGEDFGDPNCLRISYAASLEQLDEALDRIERALERLSA